MQITIDRNVTVLSLSLRNLRDLVAQAEAKLAVAEHAGHLAHLERVTAFGRFYVNVESDVEHYGERLPGTGGYAERPACSPAEADRLRQEREAEANRIVMVAPEVPPTRDPLDQLAESSERLGLYPEYDDATGVFPSPEGGNSGPL